MASALQEAIKDALPSYLNEIAHTAHYGSTTASIPFEKQEVTESTTGTMDITQNIPSIYPQTNLVHFYVNIDMVDAAVSDLPAFPVENHSTMDNKN
uniref:DUF3298 domain-containing protein n=1 Tax=Heterorhabditis bacteriophora TaxID=37862 RepID=A0A1I7XJN6_HETBA